MRNKELENTNIGPFQESSHPSDLLLIYNLPILSSSKCLVCYMKNHNLYKGHHINISWFSCGSSILFEVEFGMLVFLEGGKPVHLEKTSEQSKKQ